MKARKLKSGSWNVRVMINGKSYSFTDPDRRRCLRRASEFAEAAQEDIDNPRLIVALENLVESRSDALSPATIRGYNSIVRAVRTLHPQTAQKRALALTDRDIQNIVNRLNAPKTQRNYVNLISEATGRKFSVRYKQKQPKEVAVPSDLEVLGLIRIFQRTEMEVPVLLGAYAGLRRGEICALTIRDLDGDYLHINKDMVRDDFREWIIKSPKTPASNRVIMLPHFVADRIRAQGYVTHLSPHAVTNRFIRRQEALGIDAPYTFHSLRHFFASTLHAEHIPDAYVMRAGGWSTPYVMQKVYRHALADHVSVTDLIAVSAFQNPCQNN